MLSQISKDLFPDHSHIILYGATYSGKTYLATYINKILDTDTTIVFTGTPEAWSSYITHGADNFDENIKNIQDNCKKTGGHHLVVFDDFNGLINTQSNTALNELMTKGRHSGIRVLFLAHTTKAVGPTVRVNSRIFIAMSTIDLPEKKELASMALDNDFLKLDKYFQAAINDNEYNAIYVDKRKRDIHIIRAPQIQKRTISTDIEGTVLAQNSADTMYSSMGTGVQSTSQFGSKYAHNMVDNSNNIFNVDHSIRNDQRLLTSKVNQQIKQDEYSFELEMNMTRMFDEAVLLCFKPMLQDSDKERLSHAMNMYLKPTKKKFDIYNYNKGIPIFLKRYKDVQIENTDSIYEPFVNRGIDIIRNASDPTMWLKQGLDFYKNMR